jgi:hypothetical protein
MTKNVEKDIIEYQSQIEGIDKTRDEIFDIIQGVRDKILSELEDNKDEFEKIIYFEKEIDKIDIAIKSVKILFK